MPVRLLAPPPRSVFPEKKLYDRRQNLHDRRVAVRHHAGSEIATRLVDGKTRPRRARIRHISIRGLALIVRSRLKPGTPLLIQMTNEALDISYDLAARVVHATPGSHGQWLIGCAFARELTPVELDTLL